MKVYTHSRPGHADDVVGASILAAYLGLEVAYCDHQAKAAPGDCFVDVGGEYAPERGLYDHHHDKSLPCAAVLVLMDCLPGWQESAGWTFMSIKDTRGPAAAAAALGEVPKDDDITNDRIVANMPPSFELGRAWLGAGIGGETFATYGQLTEWLIKHATQSALEASKAAIKAADDALEAMLAASETMTVDGHQVVIGRESGSAGFPVREALARYRASFAVCPASQDGSTWKLVRDSAGAAAGINLAHMAGKPGVRFAHNSGFMCVLDGPVPSEERIAEVVRQAMEAGQDAQAAQADA